MDYIYKRLPKDLAHIINDFAKDNTKYELVLDQFEGSLIRGFEVVTQTSCNNKKFYQLRLDEMFHYKPKYNFFINVIKNQNRFLNRKLRGDYSEYNILKYSKRIHI